MTEPTADLVSLEQQASALGALDARMGRYRYWGDQKPDTSRPLLTFSRARDLDETEDSSMRDALIAGGWDAAGPVGTLRIYGPIDSWGGWWGVSSRDVARALDLLGEVETVLVRINSPGGATFEGRAIMNLLRASAATCVACVDGLAASAASYIAAGCNDRVMAPGTSMMIHDTHLFVYGDAALLTKAASIAETMSRSGAEAYADVAGGTVEHWRGLQRDETWFTASEAVAAGLADRVGIVPDSGPVETAAEDDGETEPIAVPDEDDRCDAEYDLTIFSHAGRDKAPAPKPPSAPASGSDESQEGSRTVPLIDTMRTKLGLSEDADEAAVEAAYEKSLEEKPKEETAAETVPEGHIAVPQQAWEDTQANATKGAAALEQLRIKERDDFLDAHRSKFPPASRDAWTTQYDAAPEATREWLEKAPVIVPTEELGHAEDSEAEDDVTESPAYKNWSM